MENEITNLFVKPITGFGNLKAIASLNYQGVVLRGIRLLGNDGNLWISMPARKKGESWEDIYFFTDTELRRRVLDMITARYTADLVPVSH
ncbi:MAG: septation protein SpoVG family protein [Candidatus Eremiobacteraeota bacterium]|nr:septation protein SpoVG family protein [Candidatus Eremiobacteraeota bacterium]